MSASGRDPALPRARSRGIWPALTVIFFITTVILVLVALSERRRAERGAALSETGVADTAGVGVSQEAEAPPARTPSSWETENIPAPLANVPIHELRPAGERDAALIELKTTVQWFVIAYSAPPDVTIPSPEVLILGPGDRVVWGAGPLPTLLPGERRGLAIPGGFLSRGEHQLIVEGSGGTKVVYPFRITRRRHPGEGVLSEG